MIDLYLNIYLFLAFFIYLLILPCQTHIKTIKLHSALPSFIQLHPASYRFTQLHSASPCFIQLQPASFSFTQTKAAPAKFPNLMQTSMNIFQPLSIAPNLFGPQSSSPIIKELLPTSSNLTIHLLPSQNLS